MTLQGLTVIHEFITAEEESDLINAIDNNHKCIHQWCGAGTPPNAELKRRTKQFGFLFSYRTRQVMHKMAECSCCSGEDGLPVFVQWVVNRMKQEGEFKPNHLLINEYQVGQGIMPHIDSEAIFGPTITSLSLLSDCIMTFTRETSGFIESIPIHLPRRSLLIMTGTSRSEFKHQISKDAVEDFHGTTITRGRRVSLTFRTILDHAMPSLEE